jgi:hypothetical protein
MINPGGKIQFYPAKEEKVTVPETVPAECSGNSSSSYYEWDEGRDIRGGSGLDGDGLNGHG